MWQLLIFSFLIIPSSSHPITSNAIVCVRTKWSDIFIFFVANYLAHAASILTPAGVKLRDAPRWALLGTFLPFAGLGRSIALICRYMAFGHGRGDLMRAFVSNAIVVVARSNDWKPPMRGVSFRLRQGQLTNKEFATFDFQHDYFDEVCPDYYNIHGSIDLPHGYRLVHPKIHDLRHIIDVELKPMKKLQLASYRSWSKVAVAIAQLIFSSIAIYRARGDQIDHYGYAAFGLSVFPYTLMSLVNLVCTGLVGEYSSVFVLRSAVMEEAETYYKGLFYGTIGTLKEKGRNTEGVVGGDLMSVQFLMESENKLVNHMGGTRNEFTYFHVNHPNPEINKNNRITIHLPSATSSHIHPGINQDSARLASQMRFAVKIFKKGESEVAQRAWMMAWVCANQVSYFPTAQMAANKPSRRLSFSDGMGNTYGKATVLFLLLLSIAPIGGYAEVANMMRASRSCSLHSE